MSHRISRRTAGCWGLFTLLASLALSGTVQAVSLDPALLPGIQAATFEVVAAKPATEALKYEKPLPMELVPFQERNDKYYSIGTAFAIGDGRYATAAHVLMSGLDSLWGPPALRDNKGQVYAIENVHKFSLEKDLVVFSLVDPPAGKPLPLKADARPGQTVFTVGNAYGTGIVIRDGLYTSDTPEPQDGRWNWMRFSAPASPGNSGGPLLDESGNVLGVVLAKSPNENLNFALPIGLVQSAPTGKGQVDVRVGYQFDVFDSTLTDTLKAEFKLPLPLLDFFAAYARQSDAFMDRQLHALLAKEPGRVFPNGQGSQELLHRIASMGDFPLVIARDGNGTWVPSGTTNDNIKLSANGYITPGAFGKNSLFHLRRPDDIPAQDIYGDPSAVMDLLLKTRFIKRPVGSDNVAVTSLGKPSLDEPHVDAWGRRWRLWEWSLPYANARLIVLALPVPDGYVGLVRSALSLQVHDQQINAKALTDFIYVNYDGTLAQWKEFLADKRLHPTAFDDIRIDFEYDKRFDYASDRMRLGFLPELQSIRPDSVLTLGFAFFEDNGRPVWDVAELWLSAKATDNNYLMLVRDDAPPPSLGTDYANDWEKVVNRRHPYDGSVRTADEVTKITTVAGPSPEARPEVLYTASYVEEGTQQAEVMRSKLTLLTGGLEIVEH